MNSTDTKIEPVELGQRVPTTQWEVYEQDNGNLRICFGDHSAHEPHKYHDFFLAKDEWGERSYYQTWIDILGALNAADPDWNSDNKKSPVKNACAWIAGMTAEVEGFRETVEKQQARIKELEARITELEAGAPEFDPTVRKALHRALVGAGWKAPEHPKK